MNIENIIKSANFLDFINSLDNLIFEILYSKETGYTLLSSKDAVNEAKNYISRFDNEAIKIANSNKISNFEKIINEKKQELIAQIQKHHKKEVLNWVYDVYENMKENCIFIASINKNNPEIVSKAKSRAYQVLNWFSIIQNYNEIEKKNIAFEFEKEFQEALLKSDEDYIQKKSPKTSNPDCYLKIRDLILENRENFLSLDLNKFTQELESNDLTYFFKLQNKLNTSETTEIIDEFQLVNCALNILELDEINEKYQFIKQINNDIECAQKNTSLKEDDKINIIKRRMELYQNAFKYFKNKLNS